MALWRNYLFPIPPCNGPLGHVRRSTGKRLELTPACRPSDPQNGVPKPPIWRSQTPDLGCEVLKWVPFGTHPRLLVRCIRIVGPPEIPRSPSYPGGPSTGPIALAGSAVLLVMARTWPGPDLDPQNGQFWGPKWSILATFGIKLGPKLVILGSKMAHFGGPNSSKEPRNTHLVAVYPPNMPIWAI